VIGTRAAAARLGIHPSLVRLWAKQGRLKAQKIGRDWLIEETDIERLAAIERRPGRPKGAWKAKTTPP
jgi:excisionase family DNA binding protein